MKILIFIITLLITFSLSFTAMAEQKKQYYNFKGSDAFGENTLFERNGENFSPIMGAWDENSFKKRSGGQGFDKVINLNTTFEDVMKANPTWKQQGVITPEGTGYEVYGTPNSQQYNEVSDIINKIKPRKKYKFDFTEDFSKTLDGRTIIGNYETNPKYKATIKSKHPLTGGMTGDMGDYFEIKLNPNLPQNEYKQVLEHEIGHSIFDNIKIPENLFNTNRTSGNYQSFQDMGKTTISKKETIADHFLDYINSNNIYRERYPNEAKFFDEYLNKKLQKKQIEKVKKAIKKIPQIIKQNESKIKKLPQATLYSPDGKVEPVDIGSERASFLQSLGWTLTPNNN